MSTRQLSRGVRNGPISVIYEGCQANNKAPNCHRYQDTKQMKRYPPGLGVDRIFETYRILRVIIR